MDTGSLDVLHDTRNQDICTVTDCINLNFLTHKVLIYKNWMILCDCVDDADKLFDFIIIPCNLHTLSAKHV